MKYVSFSKKKKHKGFFLKKRKNEKKRKHKGFTLFMVNIQFARIKSFILFWVGAVGLGGDTVVAMAIFSLKRKKKKKKVSKLKSKQ